MIDENFLENSYIDSSDYFGNILFYTPKIEQHIDDAEIIEEVFMRYPRLKEANREKKEKDERKIFMEFLSERGLVNDILNKYNLTIIDFIQLFLRRCSYLFNTESYSSKIGKIIEENGYRTELPE